VFAPEFSLQQLKPAVYSGIKVHYLATLTQEKINQ